MNIAEQAVQSSSSLPSDHSRSFTVRWEPVWALGSLFFVLGLAGPLWGFCLDAFRRAPAMPAMKASGTCGISASEFQKSHKLLPRASRPALPPGDCPKRRLGAVVEMDDGSQGASQHLPPGAPYMAKKAGMLSREVVHQQKQRCR